MRATHWAARICMLFIIVFPGGITWLSPSNRRRSAVSSELATAFAPWLLHLLENVPYWLSDAYFYLGQIWIASKIGINRENEVSIGKKIKVDITGKKLTFDNIRF